MLYLPTPRVVIALVGWCCSKFFLPHPWGDGGTGCKLQSLELTLQKSSLLFRDPGHPSTREESPGFHKLLSHQRNEKPSGEPRALAGRCVRACGRRAEHRRHRRAPAPLVSTWVHRGVPQPPPRLPLLPDGARTINKPLSSPSDGPPSHTSAQAQPFKTTFTPTNIQQQRGFRDQLSVCDEFY